MALTNAEKQARYRQRRDCDPVRRAQYLETERQKYKEDIRTGKKRKIKDMNEREKRQTRRKWKTEKCKSRAKLKVLVETPPNTHPHENGNNELQVNKKYRKRRGKKCFKSLVSGLKKR